MLDNSQDLNNKMEIARSMIEREKIRISYISQELKETQAKLVLADKMATLGQLMAGIAHELNTPLGAIRSQADSLHQSNLKVQTLLPHILGILNKKEIIDLIHICDANELENTVSFSSKEVRQKRKKLANFLSTNNISNPNDIARTLVDIGVLRIKKEQLYLLESNHFDIIIDYLSGLTIQLQSSKNINIGIEKATKIISALKSYTHIVNNDDKTDVDLPESLDIILTLYHNQLKHGIEVIKNYDNVPTILGNADEIGQVWTNLLQNAIYAMNGEGTLTVNINTEEQFVVVKIQDNGSGIPEELQRKIFTPFFTTKPKGAGSGIGLDVVKRTIEAHGGKIILESRPGNTVFKTYLPQKEYAQDYIKMNSISLKRKNNLIQHEKEKAEKRQQYQIEARNQFISQKLNDFKIKEEKFLERENELLEIIKQKETEIKTLKRNKK